MSEPLYAEPVSVDPAIRPQRGGREGLRPRMNHPEWMLLLATLVWGSSFALAKGAGEAINAAAGGAAQHLLGPVMVLALRFTTGSLAWFALVPLARRGWSGRSVRGGVLLGAFLASGLVLQHVALDYTIEAVAAFLTSLTVIFVPMILWLGFGERLPAVAWLGVVVAVPGVWLMSGTGSFSLGLGEWLGLACAFVFAWHLPMLNRVAAHDTPWRMCGGQFAVVAMLCWACTAVALARVPSFGWHVLVTRDVWLNVALLVAGPTLVSFGLVNVYQPRVPPVRAVLIYLLEPIFAASFAWWWSGRTMTRGMIAGGTLIVAANAVVELWPRRAITGDHRRDGG